MKVAIFGKNFNESFDCVIKHLINSLISHNVILYVQKDFNSYLKDEKGFSFPIAGLFSDNKDMPRDIAFLLSVGGDGTFLESVTLVHDSSIPIVGINSGRLGFLANISGNDLDEAIEYLVQEKYQIEERSVLQMKTNASFFGDIPWAFNECTVQKTSSSLITIQVWINGEFLNAYWADGLIISTPSGSTAYALSVGGPIVTPDSNNFIIAPIAAHNLNVRPLIIPDSAVLKLSVEGRDENFLVSLDSRSAKIGMEHEIILSKASFPIKLIKLPHVNYYSTLRNKLMWGADKRN